VPDNAGHATLGTDMSMKKTDMDKNMAKKLGGQLKTAAIPQRFGAGSASATSKKDKPAAGPAKTVPVSVRLPAELASRLRDHALGQEGGASAVVAQALAQWFASSAAGPQATGPGAA
jgi:hypothetical protein